MIGKISCRFTKAADMHPVHIAILYSSEKEISRIKAVLDRHTISYRLFTCTGPSKNIPDFKMKDPVNIVLIDEAGVKDIGQLADNLSNEKAFAGASKYVLAMPGSEYAKGLYKEKIAGVIYKPFSLSGARSGAALSLAIDLLNRKKSRY